MRAAFMRIKLGNKVNQVNKEKVNFQSKQTISNPKGQKGKQATRLSSVRRIWNV
jgi:hypothetical protein